MVEPSSIHKGDPELRYLRRGNFLLKACIFATGLTGIVAEYVMSTLASYLLGNAVIQWTITISVMLFAMGVGSRITRHIDTRLLESFIAVEILLSLTTAIGAPLTYIASVYVTWLPVLIQGIAFSIGLLIGMEIPLVTRLNETHEELRDNISSVMEKDYLGALLGGILFAFVALPYLGLTFTPVILGGVNLAVAGILFFYYKKKEELSGLLTVGFAFSTVALFLLFSFAEPIVLYGEQSKYRDTVIYQEQTPYQRIVMTRWKDDFWLYLNGNEQFSSFDEERYHEPLVHPAMGLAGSRRSVLILGGGDGLAVREVLKHRDVERITLVDLDPFMTRLGKENPHLLRLNGGSLHSSAVRILNQDAYRFMENTREIYDVIIIDLPDPKTTGLARLYSLEFYRLAGRHLSEDGVLVTQAASPFFSRKAFLSIWKTLQAAGYSAVPYHNHIPTLGEWGWVLAMKSSRVSEDSMKRALTHLDLQNIETRFLSRDAMNSMILFGKNDLKEVEMVRVNTGMELPLYLYYKDGRWDMY